MNQSFDMKELMRFLKRREYVECKISEHELRTQLETVCQNILNESFRFDITPVDRYFLAESLPTRLILRKLNDNIKRLYKEEQANRQLIISQIKVLLEEDYPCWIIKTDIQSFYESIDRDKLIAKFKDDALLSYYSMFLLKELFANNTIKESTGVPRGINISATLSEIYMRKIDRWVKSHKGVFYYARFVDDIIVFSYSLEDALHLIHNVDSRLNEFAAGLMINQSKTQLYDGIKLDRLRLKNGEKQISGDSLEYLGYKFIKNNDSSLSVLIAEKKLKKIKTRITQSFIDHTKNNDFKLLEDRIKFITSNYSIKKNEDGCDLKAGIYFNYAKITYTQTNSRKQLEGLNDYYRKILFCRNKKINCLSMGNKNKLKKYNFCAGFEKRIHNTFNHVQTKKIVKVW